MAPPPPPQREAMVKTKAGILAVSWAVLMFVFFKTWDNDNIAGPQPGRGDERIQDVAAVGPTETVSEKK